MARYNWPRAAATRAFPQRQDFSLMTTLPEVDRTFDFYGAGVARGRQGGGAPTLDGFPR